MAFLPIYPLRFRFEKKDCTDEEKARKAELRKAVKEKCNEFIKMTERKNLIGAGAFGEVWTTNLKGQSKLFVQKICRYIENYYSIHTEVSFLTTFEHIKYIPKLIYSGYTLDGKWCLIMEYFTGGTLEYHIEEEIKRKQQKMKPKIANRHKKYIAYHLACAIEYLHKLKCTHGYA